MNNNKKFGFEILEDSDIDTIEEIGTEETGMNKKDMDRILKNTMRKYEQQKQHSGMGNIQRYEETDTVSGVEVHEGRNIRHIICTALCSAAAVALIVGSISMFNRSSITGPDDNIPMAEVTTAVSTATAGTTVSGKVTSAAPDWITTAVQPVTAGHTTESTSEPADDTAISSSSEDTEQSTEGTVTTAAAAINDEPENVADAAADWKSAYKEELTNFMGTYNYDPTSAWDLQDIDGDGTPELLISTAQYHITGVLFYQYENGKAVPIPTETGTAAGYGAYGEVLICPDESLIGISDIKQGMSTTAMIRYENHKVTAIQSTYDNINAVIKAKDSYMIDDKEVSEEEYRKAVAQFESRNWTAAGRQYTFDDFSPLD